MGTFDGKVVIITGGGYGIGRGTALEFAREGAKIAIADVDKKAGEAVISEIQKIGSDAILVLADVSKASECERVVKETIDRFATVNILFNNVGIQSPDSYHNVENTSEELWDRILNVNLKSYFLMAKYSIPYIRKEGGGVVINTASVQGIQSQPLVPAYAASKGGILSLTRQMSLDYAHENIRVLAVCPGAIDTKMVRDIAETEGGDTDDVVRRYGTTHPLGRIGQPVDIANVVLFLASDKASFMTGEHVCIDGGYNALGAWASAAGASMVEDN
tara:strand:+ start:1127 stop:1948 length:822 start_codon:yes stop_codon:yes gene_type:complete